MGVYWSVSEKAKWKFRYTSSQPHHEAPRPHLRSRRRPPHRHPPIHRIPLRHHRALRRALQRARRHPLRDLRHLARADFFLFRPGLLLLLIGLLLTLPMTFGPITIGPVTFSVYWMLLGLTLSVLGLHGFYVGCIVRTFFDYGGARTRRWLRIFSYTRSVVLSALAVLAGATLAAPLVYQRSEERR